MTMHRYFICTPSYIPNLGGFILTPSVITPSIKNNQRQPPQPATPRKRKSAKAKSEVMMPVTDNDVQK